MSRAAAIPLCVAMLLTSALSGPGLNAPKTRKSAAPSPANEPFRTFALLDSRLAKLNSQQDALKRAIAPVTDKATSTKPRQTRSWTKPARDATQTANSFRILATRQQRRYRSLKEPYGVRAFHALSNRAAAVQKSAALLSHAQDDALAAKRHAIFEQDSLSLVLQYQALTGGYGAMHCSARQRPCCEPKESSEQGSDKTLGCKWTCVSSIQACRKGFTGAPISKR